MKIHAISFESRNNCCPKKVYQKISFRLILLTLTLLTLHISLITFPFTMALPFEHEEMTFKSVSIVQSGENIPDSINDSVQMAALDEQNPNIPLLVNKMNPLPDDYLPEHLIYLQQNHLYTIEGGAVWVASQVVSPLEDMLTAAHQDGLEEWQISAGYRSIQEQQEIWDEKYKKYRYENGLSESKALEAVARRVAEPGSSEHHTGLALDINVPGQSFRKTPQAHWLADHCHEYGFIIRYTAEKEHITGIAEEPWHIRYVGIEAATRMKENNWCLEEYIQKYCNRFK